MKYEVNDTTKYHTYELESLGDGNSPFAMPLNQQAVPVGSFLSGMLLTATSFMITSVVSFR
jgi:hypothetical protein